MSNLAVGPGSRRGSALLVAGHDPDAHAATAALGRIGEILLASDDGWTVRRLAPAASRRDEPDRVGLKRELDLWSEQAVDVAVLAIAGAIVAGGDGPALNAAGGTQHVDYPDDATLPLRWLGARLQRARARHVLVVLSARASVSPEALHELLGARPAQLAAIDVAADGHPLVDRLIDGLYGSALDAEAGVITLRSLGDHLGGAGASVRGARAPVALMTPLPLARRRELGWSPMLSASSSRPAPFAPETLLGAMLPGRFRLDEVLATGGFGTVYRARQLSVDRDVAIKVLHDVVDPGSEQGRLFLQEVQAVGRLDHEHVVRVYQADVAPDGRFFFAMELLAGPDLQQLIEGGAIAPARAIALTLQLLDALGAAHDAGLVHADVKPANVQVVPGRDGERAVLVDFGLARLRPAGDASRAAGGTPAYMAPEQLLDGRVDARSDLFCAALVLVAMLTGWRRQRASELVPPLDGIDDPALRATLTRALALDPADRFASAADFAAALGHEPVAPAELRPPFPKLASFTERDQGRLFGRERELALLTEHVLYHRALVFTAPSGVGKTSLLRAGLIPRLESFGVVVHYRSCRTTPASAVAELISTAGQRVVVVLDQVEAWLSEAQVAVSELLDVDRWPPDVAVVLSVREDFLARLLEHERDPAERLPVIRMGPLAKDGAREAIARPFAEHRLSIEPELLDLLLDDLVAASRALGLELGWGDAPAVYPPHLQLVCTGLYEALGPGEVVVTVAHYRRLGGLAAIVGEHLDRVLESELDPDDVPVARDLFLALVTVAQTRAARTETELLQIVAGREVGHVRTVLEVLRAHGLLVRMNRAVGEPVWELIHDSLVPRVLGWIDRHDLGRRRAMELVRYHLRRSRAEAPSLLSRTELRELDAYDDTLVTLEAEWAARGTGGPWTPARLVGRSRQTHRRTLAIASASALVVVGALGATLYDRWASAAEQRREASLRDRDLGRVAFELAPFDWDAVALTTRAVPTGALAGLRWELHAPDPADPTRPGPAIEGERVIRHPSQVEGDRRIDPAEVPGGAAFLIVDGRGRDGVACAPSVIPLQALPGYGQRGKGEQRVHIDVPTCAASSAGMIDIPAGPFVAGGPGDPPSSYAADRAERVIDLPRFRIDRTEVTNAAFAVFAGMATATGVAMPSYPDTSQMHDGGGPAYPVAMVSWRRARDYCRFLGKELATSAQWQKALRGGVMLDGRPNPMPRRNLPWGAPIAPVPARLQRGGDGPAPVGTSGDVSPYGVADLAGNVQEWTDTVSPDGNAGWRVALGGNWEDVTEANLVDFMAIENPRAMDDMRMSIGFRCASEERPQASGDQASGPSTR